MAILMQPGQFPERRRHDPKRGAKARVFDALQALDLPGRAIYELRLHEEGTQVYFALQVKDGRYRLEIWPESLVWGDVFQQ